MSISVLLADGDQAIDCARRSPPDVVVMDIRMPGTDGIEASRQIVAANPAVRVLVLATFDLDEHALAAQRAGASGLLPKDSRPADLITAIRAVATGSAVFSPRVTRHVDGGRQAQGSSR